MNAALAAGRTSRLAGARHAHAATSAPRSAPSLVAAASPVAAASLVAAALPVAAASPLAATVRGTFPDRAQRARRRPVRLPDRAQRARRRRAAESWSNQQRNRPEIAAPSGGARGTVPEATAPRPQGKEAPHGAPAAWRRAPRAACRRISTAVRSPA